MVFGVFCRDDLTAWGRELKVAVDIGANIGVAALYFLSRKFIVCRVCLRTGTAECR